MPNRPDRPDLNQGNTILTGSKALRSTQATYRFTLNNYTETEIDQINHIFLEILKANKFAFQEEICPKTETPHLQGCVFFPYKVAFSTMKKINSRIHYDRLDKPKRAISYCLKSKTRKPGGRQWTHGINIEDYLDKPKVPLMSQNELYESMRLQMVESLGDGRYANGVDLPNPW